MTHIDGIPVFFDVKHGSIDSLVEKLRKSHSFTQDLVIVHHEDGVVNLFCKHSTCLEGSHKWGFCGSYRQSMAALLRHLREVSK